MNKAILLWTTPVAVALSSTPAVAAAPFLNFPVRGYGPYSPGLISTVLDHEVPHDLTQTSFLWQKLSTKGPYGYSGAVLSFTGELFVATSQFPMANLACYPKASNTHQPVKWSTTLATIYVGTAGKGAAANCKANIALNYDNHPGYDYAVPGDAQVYAAGSGIVIPTKCVPTFSDKKVTEGACEAFGAIAVDHGNGFVTQYLHMTNVNYGLVGQVATTGSKLGKVSNVGLLATAGKHLHFEVLQRKSKPVDTKNYYARANYMIVDPYGYNGSSYYKDQLLSNPGCLWLSGCKF